MACTLKWFSETLEGKAGEGLQDHGEEVVELEVEEEKMVRGETFHDEHD